MKKLIRVEDLNVHFSLKSKGFLSREKGKLYAVNGVSFTLAKGETLGLVGESGCGKTTAGLALQRLIEPTSGDIFYNGNNICHMDKDRLRLLRREIQTVFQDPYSSLNPRMSVERIIADPMIIHEMYPKHEIRDRVAYLLKKTGLLPEHGKRYPHEFSGGQRQRIGIARALALNPKVIVADEPVSALDVSVQAQIINLLIDLQEEFGLSYIFIAHDLAVVEHICDRIAVMYLGRIVETGLYKDLFLNPKHPYTKALLSSIPIPDPDAKREKMIIQGDVPSPIHLPKGCYYYPRCRDRIEACGSIPPDMKDLGNGHCVRCHLY